MSEKKSEFGKWRSLFWPVHNFELKKLLPMSLLLFFFNFSYTILRDTKVALIVTAPGCGAETIPFLRVWVLPFILLFIIIYSKLSNTFSRQKLFYTTISFFLGYFALFALVFYPNHEFFHSSDLVNKLQTILPKGFVGMTAAMKNWTFSLFYIMAELWSSIAIPLLFWGFANDITKVSEAKRSYVLFPLVGGLSTFFSGSAILYVGRMQSKLPAGVDIWGTTINYMIGMVCLCGFIIMGVYKWINKNILTDHKFYDSNELQNIKTEKPKMSLKESFSFLARSKYIGCLTVLVIAYGIAMTLMEITWKGQVKLLYSNANDYHAFVGRFSMITGAITLLMFFVGWNVIRRFGWKVGALVTPVVLLITGFAFFSSVIFRDSLTGITTILGTTPLMLAIIFGAAHHIIDRSKSVLFDPTKEMAYIPLDQESKVKGKAAIDVLGARLGKFGGSFVLQGLILALGSLGAITPYIGGILLVIILAWIFAANSLGKQFAKLSVEKDAQAKFTDAIPVEAPIKSNIEQEVTTS
ncbi:MAG: Npt1/Npt2 family nucleotide transporter [Candidatus Rhabdochlamydia sp.]